MKILIAVLTCHAYRQRADAVRATWAKEVHGADLRFFLGRGQAKHQDEIILDTPDDYQSLPAKMQALCQWARAEGYDYVYKSDDDAYVVPSRLLASGFERWDYTGRLRGPSGIFPAPYCSGFGYWLSQKAFSIVADAPLNGDDAEDRWVANTLLQAGIRAKHDPRYAVMTSHRNACTTNEPPRAGNSLIAACEFPAAVMHSIHQEWITQKPSQQKPRSMPVGTLSKVCILVKTFLRDEYLFRCLDGLEKNCPDAKLVVIDDGYESGKKITLYSALRELGHCCAWLPLDSGFGMKSNHGLQFCDRPYVLIASDDFDFSHPTARGGIEKLLAVLEHDASMHIASGRVNGHPYESCFQISDHTVQEIPKHREVRQLGSITYRVCDLTVNYSLIRRECLGPDLLHWDDDVKIGGGEHGAFFLDAHRLGFGVCVVDDVSIREIPWNFAHMHPNYPQHRHRASQPGRICLKRRGVDHWILQDGTAELT